MKKLFNALLPLHIVVPLTALASCLFLSILGYLFPKIVMVLFAFSSLMTILTIGPLYFPNTFSRRPQKVIFSFMKETGLLKYFESVVVFVFYTTNKNYLITLFLTNILVLFYGFYSRYLFLQIVVNKTQISTSLTALLLFIGLFGVYLRLIINISLVFVPVSSVVLAGDIDSPDESSPVAPPRRLNSLFSYHRHTHNHQYPPIPPNTKVGLWRGTGLFVGICTLGAACGTLIYTKIQADAAVSQANSSNAQVEEARRNNYEMTRQNDLEELDKGIINLDEYCRRYPNSCKK